MVPCLEAAYPCPMRLRIGSRKFVAGTTVGLVALLEFPSAAGNSAQHPRTERPPCTITGTMTSETLRGTPKADVICGRGGSDDIIALAGDDVVFGGPGNDDIVGGGGGDRLEGGGGSDEIHGSTHADRIYGGLGNDAWILGGPGADRLVGGVGNEPCIDARDSKEGNDWVDGGPGRDGAATDARDRVRSAGAPDSCPIGTPPPDD
jgi:Ca2+-binding RTX toxin-like protein